MPNKILLIDGSNHAFRMFHAMPKMTAAGKHTGALLGFVNLLKKLENDHKPEAMIVVFDEGASFRVALYPEYKGHRPEMPRSCVSSGPASASWSRPGAPLLGDPRRRGRRRHRHPGPTFRLA